MRRVALYLLTPRRVRRFAVWNSRQIGKLQAVMSRRIQFSICQIEEMKRLREEGATIAKISEALSLSKSSVYRFFASPEIPEEVKEQVISLYKNRNSILGISRQLNLYPELCSRIIRHAGIEISLGAPRLDLSDGCRDCVVCKKHLPLSEFSPKKDKPCGHQSKCRQCYRAYKLKLKALNPVSYAKAAERHNKNRRGKRQDYNRAYKKENAERLKAWKHGYESRRKEVPGSWTQKEWREILNRYGDKCLRCGASPVVVEHIISLSTFGHNVADNLQPLCSSCNSWKRSRTIDFRPDRSCVLKRD